MRARFFLSVLAVLIPVVPALAQAPGPEAAYVVLGEDGAPVVRAITTGPDCPPLSVDGRVRPMRVRAPAGVEPQRPTSSTPALSKPADFAVTVCEATAPRGARRAVVGGRRLRLSAPAYRRIVVIGDTGCRLKATDGAYQACNDPSAYPFARVAAAAAAWKPDLVLHVGDYLYRENPCPADQAGCAGSPWGYGWDAWRADFFAPGAALLAAAPWIVVRGNHEECPRAGQGWWRFLDPHPLLPGRDCNAAADDPVGDASPPYAVPLGGGTQVVVLDSADTPNAPLAATDPRAAQFAADDAALRRLVRRSARTILTFHHPILAFSAKEKDGRIELRPGNQGLISVLAARERWLTPPQVSMILSGHVHVWQQVSFSSPHPTQFVAGFSGTQEDIVPLPERLAEDSSPAPGAIVAAYSAWVDGFGFMTLERTGRDAWAVTVRDGDGKVRDRCRVTGRRSRCDVAQVR